MRKLLPLAVVLASTLAPVAQAEYKFGWGNVHYDYQYWNQGAEDIDFKQALIGIEGGATFSWGQVYGFYDYEGIDKDSGEQGQTMNGDMHVYLGDTGASLFLKAYSSQSPHIKEINQFIGAGYTDLKGDGWWFTPWIGRQYINMRNDFGPNTDINGRNGFSIGWNAGYAFEAFGESFLLTNWHETELDRNDKYAENNGGSTGVNGGLNLTWNMTDEISTTVMYRYFYNKLGNDDYGDILIYRIAYNF
ncbi:MULTISPECIES: outer membrane protein OmpK [Vibrio harveyi group]|nr:MULTISPECIES: outer membrane protein OmpK [Vibrio harveyi group]ANQ28962.1 hypothetical protein BA894_21405 [Vibrio natriegens]ELB2105539.1 hypothetical protein [Vibrio parahaemolyticus]ELC3206118.1 hypothetical protein [Vibrio parahaemolyticus]MCI9688715.1 hypothetical protein [Vibrio parahaemolyticus]MCR9694120.1 hypothetical protein [Vibrio parahaemolyticus]